MIRYVDVAVIGAGHAGLNAIKEARKVTDNCVLIDSGQFGAGGAYPGRTGSRIPGDQDGAYPGSGHCQGLGIKDTGGLCIDMAEAMDGIRGLRDMFVDLVFANTAGDMGDALIQGRAEFIDPQTLSVGDLTIRTRATVIATGGYTQVPPRWGGFADGILTAENLFEQDALPESVAVLGLGPLGLEVAQALHRLGVRVVGVEPGQSLAGVSDPVFNKAAIDILARDFPVWVGAGASVERRGGGFRVMAGEREAMVEKLFVAIGRRPNLEGLGLARLGIAARAPGAPLCHPSTLQIGRLPIFVAGEAAGGLSTPQRAAAQGRIAGYNAARSQPAAFKPASLSSAVCDLNIVSVGALWSDLDAANTAVGQARFGMVGRAMIAGRNRGALRMYADKASGQILGAALIGAQCEHLAHSVAWLVDKGMTVTQALQLPYYHPVYEDAVQEALYELDRRINGADSIMLHFEPLGREFAAA